MTDPPKDWREKRRFQAVDLKQRGWKQKDIAEALDVSEGAVSQWLQKAREGGKKALRTTPRPGRPPKLSETERTEELPKLLEKGAEHFGFRGDVWTRGRVREIVKEEFGAEYDVSQIGRILAEIDWSLQKPVHRAARRDDEAIEGWKEEDWPRIKKKQQKKPEQ